MVGAAHDVADRIREVLTVAGGRSRCVVCRAPGVFACGYRWPGCPGPKLIRDLLPRPHRVFRVSVAALTAIPSMTRSPAQPPLLSCVGGFPADVEANRSDVDDEADVAAGAAASPDGLRVTPNVRRAMATRSQQTSHPSLPAGRDRGHGDSATGRPSRCPDTPRSPTEAGCTCQIHSTVDPHTCPPRGRLNGCRHQRSSRPCGPSAGQLITIRSRGARCRRCPRPRCSRWIRVRLDRRPPPVGFAGSSPLD